MTSLLLPTDISFDPHRSVSVPRPGRGSRPLSCRLTRKERRSPEVRRPDGKGRKARPGPARRPPSGYTAPAQGGSVRHDAPTFLALLFLASRTSWARGADASSPSSAEPAFTSPVTQPRLGGVFSASLVNVPYGAGGGRRDVRASTLRCARSRCAAGRRKAGGVANAVSRGTSGGGGGGLGPTGAASRASARARGAQG